MKIVLYFIVFCSLSTTAQLTFIGDDAIQRNYDGYTSYKQVPGMVTLDGKYYYITPNGNFYQTDGTEGNTRIEKQFSPQNIAYLKATNKYVYFAYGNGSGYIQDLARYSPASGLNIVRNPSDNNAMLFLNSQIVPGNNFLVDEVFTNYEKDAFLIRKFTKDNFYIYVINDHNDNAKVNLVFTQPLNDKYITTPISVNTELETYKTDVYCNGRERATGVYETTININKRTENDDTKYEFRTNFSLLKKRMYPYERFLRTKENIYTLYKTVDSATGNKTYRLFHYDKKTIFGTQYELGLPSDDVDTQVIDGEIYISCKGYLAKYNEAADRYEIIISEKDASNAWQDIAKNTRFLKVGDNYMYCRNGQLSIYNNTSKTTTAIQDAFWHKNENYFTQHKIEAYAGKNSFYFTKRINDKVEFVRYNVTANTYTPIEFPAFKKQAFIEIKAILHQGNKFVFLTAYKGKKDKPIYKMFMYNEDGEAPIKPMETITKSATKIDAKPVLQTGATPIDVKTFNKKVFSAQLVKILNDQGNQFKDITGEILPTGIGLEYKSIAKLEGFGGEKIMDFKTTSQLIRFQAETNSIKGKANALAVLDMLDKEIQSMIAAYPIKRMTDIDVKTRKMINYIYNGKINLIQLDLYTGADMVDENTYFTITLRADKAAY
jgi:hypothetical protein